jgi:hypothetical protein
VYTSQAVQSNIPDRAIEGEPGRAFAMGRQIRNASAVGTVWMREGNAAMALRRKAAPSAWSRADGTRRT